MANIFSNLVNGNFVLQKDVFVVYDIVLCFYSEAIFLNQ